MRRIACAAQNTAAAGLLQCRRYTGLAAGDKQRRRPHQQDEGSSESLSWQDEVHGVIMGMPLEHLLSVLQLASPAVVDDGNSRATTSADVVSIRRQKKTVTEFIPVHSTVGRPNTRVSAWHRVAPLIAQRLTKLSTHQFAQSTPLEQRVSAIAAALKLNIVETTNAASPVLVNIADRLWEHVGEELDAGLSRRSTLDDTLPLLLQVTDEVAALLKAHRQTIGANSSHSKANSGPTSTLSPLLALDLVKSVESLRLSALPLEQLCQIACFAAEVLHLETTPAKHHPAAESLDWDYVRNASFSILDASTSQMALVLKHEGSGDGHVSSGWSRSLKFLDVLDLCGATSSVLKLANRIAVETNVGRNVPGGANQSSRKPMDASSTTTWEQALRHVSSPSSSTTSKKPGEGGGMLTEVLSTLSSLWGGVSAHSGSGTVNTASLRSQKRLLDTTLELHSRLANNIVGRCINASGATAETLTGRAQLTALLGAAAPTAAVTQTLLLEMCEQLNGAANGSSVEELAPQLIAALCTAATSTNSTQLLHATLRYATSHMHVLVAADGSTIPTTDLVAIVGSLSTRSVAVAASGGHGAERTFAEELNDTMMDHMLAGGGNGHRNTTQLICGLAPVGCALAAKERLSVGCARELVSGGVHELRLLEKGRANYPVDQRLLMDLIVLAAKTLPRHDIDRHALANSRGSKMRLLVDALSQRDLTMEARKRLAGVVKRHGLWLPPHIYKSLPLHPRSAPQHNRYDPTRNNRNGAEGRRGHRDGRGHHQSERRNVGRGASVTVTSSQPAASRARM